MIINQKAVKVSGLRTRWNLLAGSHISEEANATGSGLMCHCAKFVNLLSYVLAIINPFLYWFYDIHSILQWHFYIQRLRSFLEKDLSDHCTNPYFKK